MSFERSDSACGEQFCRAGFDVFGDFGERWSGVGGGKFQAVILRGIVAGGEIDGAVELAALNFVSDGGSGSESVAEERANSVRMENGDGQRGEFFGVETGIVTDENGGFGGFG